MTHKLPRSLDTKILFLSLAGFLISLWLTYIHVRIHLDPFYESVCAVGSLFNCDTSASSSFSVLGNLPVSVWAAAYYLIFGLFTGAGLLKNGTRLAGVTSSLSIIAAAASAVYIFISIKYVGSICVGCFGLHLINFVVLGLCFRRAASTGGFAATLKKDVQSDARFLLHSHLILAQISVFIGLIIVAGPVGGFPRYWETASFRGGVLLSHGLTDQNLPWMGAEAPTVTVDEYFDYECPACRSSHKKLRRILAGRADIIRVIRHDMSRVGCVEKNGMGIEDRCVMARAAFCASTQQRFWEMNDAFLADPRPGELHGRMEYALELAEQLGFDKNAFIACMDHPQTFNHVEAIHQEGLGRGIKSTPTYFMGNKMMRSKEILPKLRSY